METREKLHDEVAQQETDSKRAAATRFLELIIEQSNGMREELTRDRDHDPAIVEATDELGMRIMQRVRDEFGA